MRELFLIPLLLGLSLPAKAGWGDSYPNCKEKEYSTKEITKRSKPGVVLISTDKATGSGFVARHIKNQTLILTNSHVIEGANGITIEWSDGNQDKATVVLDGGNTTTLTDLALLKIDGREGKVLPLKKDKAIVGEDVIAIGAPENLSFTLTKGIVSSLRDSERIVQTDTAINPGSSGGPLINLAGCVVGVNTLITKDSVGLNFAISSGTARRFLEKYDPSNPPSIPYQQKKSFVPNTRLKEKEDKPSYPTEEYKDTGENLTQQNPEGIRFNQLGLNALEKDKPYEAINYFSKAIKSDPNNPAFYYNRGIAKKGVIYITRYEWDGRSFPERVKDEKDAVTDFSKAITLDSTDSDFYYERAYVQQHRRDMCLDLDKAAQLGNTNAKETLQTHDWTRRKCKKYITLN